MSAKPQQINSRLIPTTSPPAPRRMRALTMWPVAHKTATGAHQRFTGPLLPVMASYGGLQAHLVVALLL
jgi:hypothetical protein